MINGDGPNYDNNDGNDSYYGDDHNDNFRDDTGDHDNSKMIAVTISGIMINLRIMIKTLTMLVITLMIIMMMVMLSLHLLPMLMRITVITKIMMNSLPPQ